MALALISLNTFRFKKGLYALMRRKVFSNWCFAFCAGVLWSVGAAAAQDIVAGAEVARTQCFSCHQVGRNPGVIGGVAPSFIEIAGTKGMTQTAIEAFLSTPHEGMPNYSLSEKQIEDVAAYVMSLRAL